MLQVLFNRLCKDDNVLRKTIELVLNAELANVVIVHINTKRRRQKVTSKGEQIGSISCGRVAFVGYSPLFEKFVIDTGCKAV